MGSVEVSASKLKGSPHMTLMIERCAQRSQPLEEWDTLGGSWRAKDLRQLLSSWLQALDKEERVLFIDILTSANDDAVIAIFHEILRLKVSNLFNLDQLPKGLSLLIADIIDEAPNLQHEWYGQPNDVSQWLDQRISSVYDPQGQLFRELEPEFDAELEPEFDAESEPEFEEGVVERVEAILDGYFDGPLSRPLGGAGSLPPMTEGAIYEPDEAEIKLMPPPSSPRASAPPSRADTSQERLQKDESEPLPKAKRTSRPSAVPELLDEISLSEPSVQAPHTGAPPPVIPSPVMPSDTEPPKDPSSALPLEPSFTIERDTAPPIKMSRIVDQELIQPGPLERLLERLTTFAWILYLFVGYSALYIVNLIDNLWSLISEYITKTFKGVMGLKSAIKVAEWRSSGQLDVRLLHSAHKAILRCERLLCLPTKADNLVEDQERVSIEQRPINPLSLAFSARAGLDDLRRDVGCMRPRAGRRTFWSALKGLAIDFIPNPISVFRPWVNIVMIGFRVKYSRQQVQETHQRLIDRLRDLSHLLKPSQGGVLSAKESEMIQTLINQVELDLYIFLTLILQSRYHAQPHRWSLFDQLGEVTAFDPRSNHPWSMMQIRTRLLEELTRRDHYNDSEILDDLLRSQRILRLMKKLRSRGVV